VPALTDEQIIAQVIEGDVDAFRELYQRHKSLIYNTCFRYVGNESEASDLTQDVFVKALRSLAGFRGNSAFSLWLYRIAVNHSKNKCKRNSIVRFIPFAKQENRECFEEMKDDDPVDKNTDVEKTIERSAEIERVQEALLQLEPDLRQVLELRLIDNKSYEEIAVLCGIPAGTVGSRLSRAHVELRNRLKE